MRRLITILNLALFINFLTYTVTFSQSRKPIISFETINHDFGTFKEENGPVKYIFKFTNKGNAPLLVTDVKPSCGCTTPDWTKNPVQPGQSGFVSASYDPSKRPGNFDKTITVSSNAEQVTLTITGEVIAKVKTNDDIYPIKYDIIRLDKDNPGFAKILNTETVTDTINVLNSSNESVKLSFENVPSFVNIKNKPELIKPKGKGYIVITFYAYNAKYWGFKSSNIKLLINNKSDPTYQISVSATIEEDFSKLSKEQIANAPVISFDNKEYNFGNIKQGQIRNFDFKYSNKGKRDLFIRDIKATSEFKVKSSEDIIKPGKSANINVSYNSANKKDKQNKFITIVSNDPKNNEVLLKITGIVDVNKN
jgi:hypothetical protein